MSSSIAVRPRAERDLIFYRPIEGGIEVVRVLHGARDTQAALVDAWE